MSMSACVTDSKGAAAQAAVPSARPPGDAVIRKLAPADEVLLNQLLTEPADYVDHPVFHEADAEQQLFGAEAELLNPQATEFAKPEVIVEQAHKGGRVPTLTHQQEQQFFLRFNYARAQVSRILAESADQELTGAATRQLLAWGRRVRDCQALIVRVNMPLVLAMSKRTRLTNIDHNELISEGNMALLRSVDKFDCARGYKFSTYACRAILKSFSRVAMRVSRYRNHFPTEYDANLERSDYVDTKRESVELDCVDELKEILLQNLAELTEVERVVIRERFAIGKPAVQGKAAVKTLEEVGGIIGVTKERVRQIQNKALKKIRSALEERYLAA
jgi:RNA polymerase primary sigma factor